MLYLKWDAHFIKKTGRQMDKIFLRGMKADTLIGVYDWERERP